MKEISLESKQLCFIHLFCEWEYFWTLTIYRKKKTRFSSRHTLFLWTLRCIYLVFRQIPAGVYILPNDSISIETHATVDERISLVFMGAY